MSIRKTYGNYLMRISWLLALLCTACLQYGVEIVGVTPGSGYAGSTAFTFAARARLLDNQSLRLSLWSPDINNDWSWHTLPTEKVAGSEDRYQVTTALAEHSPDYRYKFEITDTLKGTVLSHTAAQAGPRLLVNTADRQPPQVARTAPEHLSFAGSEPQQLIVVFDEIIDPASVNSGSLQINGSDVLLQSIRGYQNRLVATLTQAAVATPVDFNQQAKTIAVTVQGVRDLNGNTMTPDNFQFIVDSPALDIYAIESGKHPGGCLAVLDERGLFIAPQAWNPVVQLVPCVADSTNGNNAGQRWFLGAVPGSGKYAQVRWAYNHHYCLTKPALGNPSLTRCTEGDAKQLFNVPASNGLFIAQSGGCVAASVVDLKGGNQVESSLCVPGLPRNYWTAQASGRRELSEPFMLGKYDIRYADVAYHNPATGSTLTTDETRDLVRALYNTTLLNQAEIYQQLQLQDISTKGAGFSSANPYFPRYQGTDIPLPKVRSATINGSEVSNPEAYADTQEGYHLLDNGTREYYGQKAVAQWFSDVSWGKAAANEVCAVKFDDKANYQLRTFASQEAAEQAGWQVTHQYHCGACSSLKDLAVYIGVKDQTTPVRLCTKRGMANNDNLDEVKQCIQESVGFSEMCAEAWAYNGIHTGQECQGTCLQTYGRDALLFPVVRGVYNMFLLEKFNACPPDVNSDDPVFRKKMQSLGCPLANEKTGKLNDCLWCDEHISGPSFKFFAARTRRNSGLDSEIPRPNDKLYYGADHTQYFR